MSRADRLTMLCAAMLQGQTCPGDKLMIQVLMLANAMLKKIEELEPCSSK